MGIDDTVRGFLQVRQGQNNIVNRLPHDGSYEQEFRSMWERRISFCEFQVLGSIKSLAAEVIREVAYSPDTVLAPWQMDAAILKPLLLLAESAQAQYAAFRGNPNVMPDEAFERSMEPVTRLLGALTAHYTIRMLSPEQQRTLDAYLGDVRAGLRPLVGKGLVRIND